MEMAKLIRLTDSIPTAAAKLRVSVSIVYEWLDTGAKHLAEGRKDSIFSDLLEVVAESKADFEIGHLGNITSHAKKDWRASLALLERRRKEFRLNSDPIPQAGSSGAIEVRFVEESPASLPPERPRKVTAKPVEALPMEDEDD